MWRSDHSKAISEIDSDRELHLISNHLGAWLPPFITGFLTFGFFYILKQPTLFIEDTCPLLKTFLRSFSFYSAWLFPPFNSSFKLLAVQAWAVSTTKNAVFSIIAGNDVQVIAFSNRVWSWWYLMSLEHRRFYKYISKMYMTGKKNVFYVAFIHMFYFTWQIFNFQYILYVQW